jgi:hypothetical protein
MTCPDQGVPTVQVAATAAGTYIAGYERTKTVDGQEVVPFENDFTTSPVTLSNYLQDPGFGQFSVRAGRRLTIVDFATAAVGNGFGTNNRCFLYGMMRVSDL